MAISDNQNSLRAHPRGPTLLEDFILREKITHFDHERIPERIVHARGSGAHGFFELTDSLADYTTAQVLTEVGRRRPSSPLLHGGRRRRFVDTPRDVRGFAVKFYTQQGNWDLVGNNIPVFFIQDAIKFPDLIHAVKMEPDRGFPQAASRARHLLGLHLADAGIDAHGDVGHVRPHMPRSLRMIEGFGIHSFRLINAAGKSTFVKFHWRPVLGLQSTVWDEAVKIAGADPDFHRRDLFEAIAAGNSRNGTFAVQLFTEEEAAAFPFDHLDATKLIPEELVPLQEIGRMVLDRWPDNFFAETEQVAFCPSQLVPGIDFSNDPLLQGRLHSYLDTQLSRLGSANFHQIPVNAPQCPFSNQQRDGHMQMGKPTGRVAYEPSSLAADSARESPDTGFRSTAIEEGGQRGRIRTDTFADHYSQPRQFWRSQTVHEQAHIASALVFELSKVEHLHIRAGMVGHLCHIDAALARRVADGLGIVDMPAPPAAARPAEDRAPSPALRTIGKGRDTLAGRVVAILMNDGTDDAAIEALHTALVDAGATVKLVAPKVGGAKLRDGSTFAADGQLAGTPSVMFDAVAIVLSSSGAVELSADAAAIDFVRDAFGHLKALALDDGGRTLLKAAGLVADAGVFDADDCAGFVAAAGTRQWAREKTVRMLA
jgi:catalase